MSQARTLSASQAARQHPWLGRLTTSQTDDEASGSGRTLYLTSARFPDNDTVPRFFLVFDEDRGTWLGRSSTQVSLTIAVGDTTTYPSAIPHDVFYTYNANSGTIVQSLYLRAWDNLRTPPNPRFQSIGGRLCIRHPDTRSVIPYIGTVVPLLLDGQVQFVNLPGKRLVWNAYDRRLRIDRFYDRFTPTPWIASTPGYGLVNSVANAEPCWKFQYVCGLRNVPSMTRFQDRPVGFAGSTTELVPVLQSAAPSAGAEIWTDTRLLFTMGLDTVTAALYPSIGTDEQFSQAVTNNRTRRHLSLNFRQNEDCVGFHYISVLAKDTGGTGYQMFINPPELLGAGGVIQPTLTTNENVIRAFEGLLDNLNGTPRRMENGVTPPLPSNGSQSWFMIEQ